MTGYFGLFNQVVILTVGPQGRLSVDRRFHSGPASEPGIRLDMKQLAARQLRAGPINLTAPSSAIPDDYFFSSAVQFTRTVIKRDAVPSADVTTRKRPQTRCPRCSR